MRVSINHEGEGERDVSVCQVCEECKTLPGHHFVACP